MTEFNRTYELPEAAQAHRDLTARKTIGSIVFTVQAGMPSAGF
jgi:hypothetical protein